MKRKLPPVDMRDQRRIAIRLLLVVLVGIFIVELGIMLLFNYLLPQLPPFLGSLLDSFLLVIILFPLLYLFIFQPLLTQFTEQKPSKMAPKYSGLRLFIAVAATIFTIEFAIMLVMDYLLPPLPPLIQSLVDSTLLILLVFPLLNLLGLRPILDFISERKRAEEDLRESEETFRSLANLAHDAIIMVDSQSKVTYWNQAAERTFGYTSEEILNKNYWYKRLGIPTNCPYLFVLEHF